MRNKANRNITSGRGYVRVIAGEWRGRKIAVPLSDGLRPTTDRIRETVFNWLMPYLSGAVCLDACSGTGILGFESLSRGAASVDFVEKSRSVSQVLQANLTSLGGNGVVHNESIEQFLHGVSAKQQPYDLVFIDPPFSSGLQESICHQLWQKNCLSNSALIYVESELQHDFNVPEAWDVFREKRSGKVKYQLLRSE